MKISKSNEDTPDRLSALPESLIFEILSLLEMRDVVKTTLLSKYWKYLWITTPCLQFVERRNPAKIHNFVTRVLALWRGTHLRKFSICFYSYSIVNFGCLLSSDIDFWVLFAKQRRVEELCIKLYCNGPRYCPPQCFYECSSIRKLELHGCNLRIRGNVQWYRLNSLHLSSCLISEDAIDHVFSSSSSPQLETFVSYFIEGFENLSIRSSSLKKLWISSINNDMKPELTICCPNVEELKFNGRPFSKYLLSNVSSLIDVSLNFYCEWDPEVGEALRQILSAIQHVAIVKLSDVCLKMLGVMKGKYSFPPLLNVRLLRIDSGVMTKLSELLHIFEVFPKLKMLVIDWEFSVDPGELFELNAENYIMSEANIFKTNLLQLRTVEITFYSYKVSLMLQFIEFLLKHATMMEKIVIQKGSYSVVELEDVFLVARHVLSLQRSFPSVELIIL